MHKRLRSKLAKTLLPVLVFTTAIGGIAITNSSAATSITQTKNLEDYKSRVTDTLKLSNPVKIRKAEVLNLDGTKYDKDGMDVGFGAGYANDEKLLDVVNEEGCYIYSVETGKQVKYSDNIYMTGNWSDDGAYLLKYGQDQEDDIRTFYIYNKEGKLISQKSISDKVDYVSLSSKLSMMNGDTHTIIFNGRLYESETMKTGLYSFNMKTGEVKPLMDYHHNRKEMIKNPGTDLIEHPGEYLEVNLQSGVYAYDFLDDDKIIFNGMVDSVSGLYKYDMKTKALSLLLEVDGGLGYSISPSGDRIAYTIDQPIYDGVSSEEVDKGPEIDPDYDGEKVDSGIDFDNLDEQAESEEAGELEETREYEVYVIPNDTNAFVADLTDDGLENISYLKSDTFVMNYKWSNESKTLQYYIPSSDEVEEVTFE